MNKERVKELEDFAEDFNKRLEEAFERFNNNVPTIYNKIGKGRIRKDKAIFISDSPHFDIIKKKEAVLCIYIYYLIFYSLKHYSKNQSHGDQHMYITDILKSSKSLILNMI